jgi:hypothetical protein
MDAAAAAAFTGGAGGGGSSTGTNSNGGLGGAVGRISVRGVEDAGTVHLTSGQGGDGANTAGSGGALFSVSISGGAIGEVIATAGQAGALYADSISSAAGRTGVTVNGVSVDAETLGTLRVQASDGTAGGVKFDARNPDRIVAAGAGGVGGSILDVNLSTVSGATEVTLVAGNGADAGDPNSAITGSATVAGVNGGGGGSIGGLIGPATTPSNIKGVTLSNVGALTMTTGSGGAGANGGSGGSISYLTLTGGTDDTTLDLTVADGGAGFVNGGAGGSMSAVDIDHAFSPEVAKARPIT